MAPCASSTLCNAVAAARCSRKRQFRRIGTACNGRSAACSRRGTCKLITEQEVRATEQDVQVALSTHACSTESAPVHAKNGQCDAGVATMVQYPSKAIAAKEAPDRDSDSEVSTDDPDSEDAADDSDVMTPLAEEVSSRRKSVRFDLEATTIHEVIPYGEIYGAHPRRFVFDKDSQMIPAARGGFVSAGSTLTADEDEEEGELRPDDSSLFQSTSEADDASDGGWETWLLEQDGSLFTEFHEASSAVLVRESCLPDLDDEAGWETWLDSTLGSTQEDDFQ